MMPSTSAHPQQAFPRNTAELPAGYRRTTPGPTAKPVSTYKDLLAEIRAAGLLERRQGWYITLFAILTGTLAGAVALSVVLGDSWWQLPVAAVLGVLFTQYAFLAHEVAHRQVFHSASVSRRAGHLLGNGFVGMSYSWWITKHTRHHGNPNTVGKDPDISFDALSFREEDAVRRTGFLRWFVKRQGTLFFPLLLVEGLNLHVTSFRTIFGRTKTENRGTEITLITIRTVVYLAAVFWVMSPGIAFAFLGVQLAVFGLYMGASFAPNHIGMAIIPEHIRIDFLAKQVLTSRNIRGGTPMTLALGGLDYQIEHHLFPSMARPHLKNAALLVQAHCATQHVPYTQATLPTAFRTVITYLNTVGHAARNPFECPVANSYRPR